MTAPLRLIKIPRDLTSAREAIAKVVGPGEKMHFLTFMQQVPATGRLLALAWAEALAPLADAWFGEPAVSVLQLGTVRHHTTRAAERAPWHCDANFFGGAGGRGLTFWLTLDDAGRTAPGVEFEFDGQAMTPVVPAGSALMFGPHVKHRTQLIDGDRISVEFRCSPRRLLEASGVLRSLAVVATELRDGGRWLCLRQGDEVLHSERIDQATVRL